MRTSVKSAGKFRTSMSGKFMTAGLAVAVIVATTSAVSFQDIAEMTGTDASDGPRWLARFVDVPVGSSHSKIEARLSANADTKTVAASKPVISHRVAVKTANLVHSYGDAEPMPVLASAEVSKSLMGDRVYEAKEDAFNVEQASWVMLQADTIVTGSVSQNASLQKTAGASTNSLALAQTFRPTKPAVVEEPVQVAAVVEEKEKTLSGAIRLRLERGQLQQARAAARLMATVFEKVKRQKKAEDSYAAGSTVSAYAPQERDIASAFSAVLRPSVKAKKKRNVIRLGRGDHKWAAKKLPKHAFSRNERQCLAVGVYFEARGEPVKGQKAVAQVILNRVKNPAYPNSICGVVYQNKWKRNACQFSFACDGIRDRVNSKRHWKIAANVANGAIDGKYWLKSVGSSSHYHADYVWPRWRRSMKKMTKIGRHIFYRTYGGGWS